MKAPVVRLKIRVRLAGGSRRFLDPVFSANKKLKPLHAMVDGQPVSHPEGVYFLRYARGEKRIWENVGNDSQLALLEKQKREKALAAKAVGVELAGYEPSRDPGPEPTLLSAAIEEYLAEIKVNRAKNTWVAYEHTLRMFAATCGRNTSRTSIAKTSSPSQATCEERVAAKGPWPIISRT